MAAASGIWGALTAATTVLANWLCRRTQGDPYEQLPKAEEVCNHDWLCTAVLPVALLGKWKSNRPVRIMVGGATAFARNQKLSRLLSESARQVLCAGACDVGMDEMG
jgi:hypothetical protein